MSAITAKASRKMKKYAVLTREPRCFLGSFDFSWEQRKLGEIGSVSMCRRIFKEQTSETGDIPFYKIGTFGADPDAFISRELFEEYKSKYPYPQKGDILISASGSIGRAVEFAGNNEYFQDSNIVWLNHDERLSNPFLKCFYSVVKWAGIEGSTIKRLYNDNILNTVICMPSVPEQKRIGLFFENLDNLITLHQRKCVFLFGFFQAFISMIFTASTFSWEQRKFSDVVATRRGLTYKPSDIRKNGVRVLRSSNIAEDSFVLSDEDVFVVREAVNIDCVRANDILITAANGSSRLVGKHTIISGIPEESAVHGGFMLLGTTKEPHFVNASMGSSWYRRFIELFVAGGNGAIGNLNKNDLDNQDIAIPSEKEQKKIGSFFRQLDNLITLHQRQPFLHSTPEISLTVQLIHPFYTSSWEQRKAKELFVSTADKGYPELPVLSATQDRGMIRRDENSINIFHDKKNEAGYKRVLPGQFVIHLRSFQGGFAHSAIEGITSPAYTVFGFSEPEKHDSEYWKYVFTSKSFIQRLETVTYGIRDGRSISYEEFLTLGFVYPSKAEQTAIARYLDKLSDLITLHQRKPFLMKWRTSDANRNQTNRLVL